MARLKTEHAGAKNRGGHRGRRAEAKQKSKKARRESGRREALRQDAIEGTAATLRGLRYVSSEAELGDAAGLTAWCERCQRGVVFATGANNEFGWFLAQHVPHGVPKIEILDVAGYGAQPSTR